MYSECSLSDDIHRIYFRFYQHLNIANHVILMSQGVAVRCFVMVVQKRGSWCQISCQTAISVFTFFWRMTVPSFGGKNFHMRVSWINNQSALITPDIFCALWDDSNFQMDSHANTLQPVSSIWVLLLTIASGLKQALRGVGYINKQKDARHGPLGLVHCPCVRTGNDREQIG